VEIVPDLQEIVQAVQILPTDLYHQPLINVCVMMDGGMMESIQFVNNAFTLVNYVLDQQHPVLHVLIPFLKE